MKSICTREEATTMAHVLPAQGQWTEEEYLALDGNRIVEFSNGRLEASPMPTTSHQLLVAYLYGLLSAFTASKKLGTTLFAALPVRLWEAKYREPDVVFMRKEHADCIHEEWWDGADLVMEVVSKDAKGRRRDLVTKRREYARAGIPEYWIVDPQESRIIVLRLVGKRYVAHGEFPEGTQASSHLLRGFTVSVTGAFSRGLPGAKKARKPTA
jgi:Uma2 family endonuclease